MFISTSTYIIPRLLMPGKALGLQGGLEPPDGREEDVLDLVQEVLPELLGGGLRQLALGHGIVDVARQEVIPLGVREVMRLEELY